MQWNANNTIFVTAVPPLAGQLPPTTPPTPLPPEPVPPDILEEVDSVSAEELMDLFQRPLYDIQRAWRAPLFRIVQRLSQGILQGSPEDEKRCTLACLILPGLVLWEVDPSGGALVTIGTGHRSSLL